MGKGFLHDPAMLEGNAFSKESEEYHGYGHESQSADLYQ